MIPVDRPAGCGHQVPRHGELGPEQRGQQAVGAAAGVRRVAEGVAVGGLVTPRRARRHRGRAHARPHEAGVVLVQAVLQPVALCNMAQWGHFSKYCEILDDTYTVFMYVFIMYNLTCLRAAAVVARLYPLVEVPGVVHQEAAAADQLGHGLPGQHAVVPRRGRHPGVPAHHIMNMT